MLFLPINDGDNDTCCDGDGGGDDVDDDIVDDGDDVDDDIVDDDDDCYSFSIRINNIIIINIRKKQSLQNYKYIILLSRNVLCQAKN